MAAFASAVALGYRYVETDVHATADGVPIAFHDDRLDRLTDRVGRVSELPWSAVARARVAGTEPIVRLDELLVTWPDIRINLDPKHDAAVRPLIRAIRDARALDRVCVGAFTDARLTEVRAAFGSAVCTSLGPREVLVLRAASWAGRAASPVASRFLSRGPGMCVQVPLASGPLPLADAALLRAAHAIGLPVHVWTVNDPLAMDRLLDLGVDGLMTDVPRVLRDVLRRRGGWLEPEVDATTGREPGDVRSRR